MTAWWLADLTWEIVQSCLPAPGPAPAPFLSEECSSLRVRVSDTGSDRLAPAPAPGTGAGRRVFRTRETGLAGPAAATNDVLRDLPWLRAVYTLSLAPMRWGDQTPHVSRSRAAWWWLSSFKASLHCLPPLFTLQCTFRVRTLARHLTHCHSLEGSFQTKVFWKVIIT